MTNKVTDKAEHKAIFFTVCGAELYNLAASLYLPKLTSDVYIGEILTRLWNNFESKSIEIIEIFEVHKRDQHEG